MDLENAAGLRRSVDKLSKWQKRRVRNGAKVLAGYERREGWSGELPFYIFWCSDCENFSYDYPHGHIERQYLSCHNCNAKIDFRPWWIEFKMMWEFLKAMRQRR